MPNIRGIDVSHLQGTISWARVAAEGIEFAFIKATEGKTMVDPQFETNRAGAKAAGLKVGFYHFFQPLDDASAQAAFFLNTVGAVGANELGVALDIEAVIPRHQDDLWLSLPQDERVAAISTWLSAVDDNYGQRSFVYTAPLWFNTVLGDADFSGHPLWVAEYGVSAPKRCGAWSNYTLWQYDPAGQIAGVQSGVDLNVWHGDSLP